MERSDERHSERRTAHGEWGASAVEYSFIVASIAAILVIVVFAVGRFTGASFDDTCRSLASGGFSATSGCP